MARKFLFWFAPRWSFVSRRRRDIRRGIKELQQEIHWKRVAWLSVLPALATLGIVIWANQGVPLPTPSGLLGLAMVLAICGLGLWATSWIPPSFVAARHPIWMGNRTFTLRPKDIVATQLILHPGNRARLKIRVKKVAEGRTVSMVLSIGVARRINLDELAEILPVRPVVRDARRRRIGMEAKE